ncbi:MAG TPA: cysteine desulfurase family protein [Anaerolineales bacterium]|nr:cysteine desulfurase family protein [Anaerolineales bacterium]HRQ92955.1 cysteine desulfurase family protein [Anaerolineales bacterium]
MDAHVRRYFDYAATTPLDPRVWQAMQPYFEAEFGNPSSVHGYGQRAEAAVEQARGRLAAALGCQPEELLFTSGGTESDNLALRGAALAARRLRGANRLLVSPVEHPAVARTAQQLTSQFGFELTLLPVDEYGQVNPQDVARLLTPDTALVSVILANNEIGTINPISEIAAICRERGVVLHSDAVQAPAYLPLNVNDLGIDLLSLGAHKLYGPKGVGLLYVREGTPLQAMQTGGSHESGLRAGTHNVPYIVGMAEAFELAQTDISQSINRLIHLRNKLITAILEEIPDSRLTGHPTNRLPNHASFVFQGVDGNALLMLLDDAGFACSSGSACKTGDPQPSEVLLAMGITPDWAAGSLRLTLGKHTSEADVDALLAALPALVESARSLERIHR